jgi:hypothetical protein
MIDQKGLQLSISKEPTYPDIHHGWKLFCGAYETSHRRERCSSFTRHGLYGKSGDLPISPLNRKRDRPGMCMVLITDHDLMAFKPSTCNTYKAIEQANSSRAHLDVTGIGATACNHGFFVPTSVVDFQKGERYVPYAYTVVFQISDLRS